MLEVLYRPVLDFCAARPSWVSGYAGACAFLGLLANCQRRWFSYRGTSWLGHVLVLPLYLGVWAFQVFWGLFGLLVIFKFVFVLFALI